MIKRSIIVETGIDTNWPQKILVLKRTFCSSSRVMHEL